MVGIISVLTHIMIDFTTRVLPFIYLLEADGIHGTDGIGGIDGTVGTDGTIGVHLDIVHGTPAGIHGVITPGDSIHGMEDSEITFMQSTTITAIMVFMETTTRITDTTECPIQMENTMVPEMPEVE